MPRYRKRGWCEKRGRIQVSLKKILPSSGIYQKGRGARKEVTTRPDGEFPVGRGAKTDLKGEYLCEMRFPGVRIRSRASTAEREESD